MARSKVTFDTKALKADIEKYQSKAKEEAKQYLEKEIPAEILGGRSPVKGFGRFARYSDTYLEQIKNGKYKEYGKKKRPVNLKLTGELLKSFFVKVTSRGLEMGFDNELADIHNRKGAGKSGTARRMLPTNPGESFNRSITNGLEELLVKLAKKIFNK